MRAFITMNQKGSNNKTVTKYKNLLYTNVNSIMLICIFCSNYWSLTTAQQISIVE